MKSHSRTLSFKAATLIVAIVALAVLTFGMPWQNVGQFWSYINVAKLILAGIIAYLVVFWWTPARQQYTLFRWFAMITVPLFALVATGLLLFNPHLAELLVRENHAFENMQAWFMFIGALFMGITAVRLFAQRHTVQAVGALLLGIVMFCVGGEEISWGMWLFDTDPNAFFAEHNAQGETNFHNMDTFLSEDLYYFVSFIWLVMVPFLRDPVVRLLQKLKIGAMEAILPSAWMILPWTLMTVFVAPYSYKQSTILLGFLGAAFVLIHTLLAAIKQSKGRAWAAAGLLVMLVAIGSIYTFSPQSALIDHIRGGSPKEYMETIIAFGMVVYAIDTYVRLFVRGIADKKPLLQRVLSR